MKLQLDKNKFILTFSIYLIFFIKPIYIDFFIKYIFIKYYFTKN